MGQGRWRAYSPLDERSQRMHQFTARLLAGVADATAGGVDGVAISCLNAREAGESVLELGEVITRLQGLRLRLLAHADGLEVCTQVEGPAPVDTAGWLAHRDRGGVAGRGGRFQAGRDRRVGGQAPAGRSRSVGAGHRLLEVVDPEVAEATEAKRLQKDEDAAAARTWFTTWDDGEGTTHLSAKLATRHADMLRKALHAIAPVETSLVHAPAAASAAENAI